MASRHDIAALVLAAGYSTRMKRFKPLLPMGPMTTLERSIRLFKDSGIEDVRVVLGHRADEVKPLLDRLGVRWILNDRFELGMFSSIQAGVRDLEPSTRAFFVLPVDIPLVRRITVGDLLTASDGDRSGIWYPCFVSKRGHPPLISTDYRSAILDRHGDGGLRKLLQQYESHAVHVEVADEYVLKDMDTPERYDDLLTRLIDYDIPSATECMVLLTAKFRVPGHVLAHSSKVSQVALHLSRALNEHGCSLNLKLVVAAALLHDVAKGRADHAAIAEGMLIELGYPTVANVVGCHMDAQPQSHEAISYEEVVHIADKMVRADRIVSVAARFRHRLGTCGTTQGLAERVYQRRSRTLGIKERLERTLGCSVESCLSVSASAGGENRYEDLSLLTW